MNRLRDASGDAAQSEPPPLTSKDLLIGHIKQNFDLETQRYQQRNSNEAHEEQKDAGQAQDQMRRLKRRCARLERKLQEKEAEIHALQDQEQLRFPLLMHETMRSLRSLENNLSDCAANALPLSHSVISGMAHERQDVDARIHEYERQIAELYEENQQEKLKNEMLSECLRDQKHAKAKLMKVCKHMKQQLQAVKDSGLSQMLVDIEARCDALEKEKTQLVKDLVEERSLSQKQETEQKDLIKQLEDLIVESAKWDEIVDRKNENLQQARAQICEQQLTIENMKTDLKLAGQRTAHSQEHCLEDDQQEIERLQRTISLERAKYENALKRLATVTAENDIFREQLATRNKKVVFRDATCLTCVDHDTHDQMLLQVRFIKCKLRALKDLVQMYEETNSIDINLLDEENCFQGEDIPETAVRFGSSCTMELSESVLEAVHYLSELQQTVEDVCARLMGRTCALQ
ncbi:hypothetical protein KRP22_000656 [Phytophthora ramorum]|nr:hypothetical protein KRP22_608 [Phytophthora ramorum]